MSSEWRKHSAGDLAPYAVAWTALSVWCILAASPFHTERTALSIQGVYPTNHQEHETLEITQGITDWMEVGFYFFTSEQNGHGVQWVGDHIRPRVRVPSSWHWPISAK